MRFDTDMAQHLNASLLLLHVCQVPVTIREALLPLVNVDELQNVCATVQPFAVILGTKGSGALEHTLFKIVTLISINYLDVPVMVIAGLRYKPVHTNGLACDFKNPEEGINELIINLLLR